MNSFATTQKFWEKPSEVMAMGTKMKTFSLLGVVNGMVDYVGHWRSRGCAAEALKAAQAHFLAKGWPNIPTSAVEVT